MRKIISKKILIITLGTIIPILLSFLTVVYFEIGHVETEINLNINNIQEEIVKDFEGNEYHTVKIGNQIWMLENYKVAHYADGSIIEEAYDYKDNPENSKKTGKFYTYKTISSDKGFTPDGWHVPSDGDWKELEKYIGMSEEDIEKTGWRNTNNQILRIKAGDKGLFRSIETIKKVNNTGFTALAGGVRQVNGNYVAKGMYADYWSSTEADEENAYNRSLVWLLIHPGKNKIFRSAITKKFGFSVKLIKDKE